MAKIELNNYDLMIKELDDGKEVVQLSNRIAFNEEFIEEMREKGVKKYITQEEDYKNGEKKKVTVKVVKEPAKEEEEDDEEED